MTAEDRSAITATDTPGTICIGVAESPYDRERVFHFRYRVYVEEMGKHDLSCADHETATVRDELDEFGTLFYAESDGRVVATMRLSLSNEEPAPALYRDIYALEAFDEFPPSSLSFSARLMIERAMRGSPALRQILVRAYEVGLDTEGQIFNFCHCSPSLVSLYEHLGYRRYKDNIIDPDVGYRVPMVPGHEARSPAFRRYRSRSASAPLIGG